MTKAELIAELNLYRGDGNIVSTVLYFVLETENGLIIKKVDIENIIQDRLTILFNEYVAVKFIENEDLSYLPLSESDDRKNVAYRYDFDELPLRLSFMNQILENPSNINFNFRTDSLNDLFGYLMVVGNESRKLSIFRKHHPIDLVRRDRRLYLIKSNERFVQMPGDGFIIDKGFDFMKIGSDLVIIKPKILEKDFGFDEIIERESEASLTVLENSSFIENITEFKAYSSTNRAFQRKLIKAKNSPVLNVPFERVANFIKNNTSLSRKLRLNADETQFTLTSAASKKLFLKLLNDDYLNSPLTEIQYDSRAKDILVD